MKVNVLGLLLLMLITVISLANFWAEYKEMNREKLGYFDQASLGKLDEFAKPEAQYYDSIPDLAELPKDVRLRSRRIEFLLEFEKIEKKGFLNVNSKPVISLYVMIAVRYCGKDQNQNDVFEAKIVHDSKSFLGNYEVNVSFGRWYDDNGWELNEYYLLTEVIDKYGIVHQFPVILSFCQSQYFLDLEHDFSPLISKVEENTLLEMKQINVYVEDDNNMFVKKIIPPNL